MGVPRRRKRLLLAVEKILLHLEEFGRFEGAGEAPYSITQNGIGDRVGLQRSHVPRPLKRLMSQGLVREHLSHVRGGGRSRHVYFLTWEGSQAALALRARTAEAKVDVLVDGAVRRARVREVRQVLGVRAGALEIAIGAEKGPLTAGALKGELKRDGLAECIESAPAPRPFFGRERELGIVSTWLDGEARLVTLVGPSGIGKTSTALRLMQRSKGRHHLFWLSLHEWDSLVSVLRPLAAFLARTGRGKLAAYLAGPGQPEPSTVNELLISEFHDLGALMVIDDLQKAPDEVAGCVGMMASAALAVSAGPRMLVLSRERRQLCDPRQMAGDGVRELVLEGLDPAAAARLAGRRLSKKDQERVLSAAGGLPLYIELLSAHGPTEGRSLVWEHLRAQLLAGLGAAHMRILRSASVFGRPVPAAGLLSGSDDPSAIDQLIARNLLARTADGLFQMHDLLKEYFSSSLTCGEKAAQHRRAADYLLLSGDRDATDLLDAMRHLLLAGDRARAVRVAVESGPRLAGAGLGGPLLSEILGELGPDDAGPGWPSLLLLRAGLRASRGEPDGALKDYRELAQAGGPLSAEALLATGAILEERSDWAGAATAYSEASGRDESARPAALRGAARVEWRMGQWKDADRKFEQALRLARRSGLSSLSASILADMGNLESDRGSPDKGLRLYERALGILEKENASLEMARVHNNIGAVLFYEGMWDEALEHYQKCLELSERSGELSNSAYALSNIGQILARRGKEKRALTYLDASTRTFERLGDDYMLSSNLLARAILYRVIGDKRRSLGFFRQGIDMLKKLDMPRELAEARFEHGVALRELGYRKRAAKELRYALAQFKRLGAASERRKAERELKKLR